jgi:TetR/AcrR family transcriptional regulator, transcriptional repressor for nem operon
MVKSGGDARERLIESTRQLLWDRGYVGTSPTAIVAQSGVGQGSMYHHFSGKRELALAAEERSAALVQREIRACFAIDGTAYERIEAFLLSEREVLRGCSVGRLAADPEVMADDGLREPIRSTFAMVHDCLRRAIDDGRAAGEFDERLDAEKVASAISAVIQGGYSLAQAEQSVEPFDHAVQGALGLLRAAAPAH